MVTIDDINRNFRLAQEGKALDMPLAVLDGRLLSKAYREANKKLSLSEKRRRIEEKYSKQGRMR